jgi:biopolymer transport protein ExbB
VFALLSATPISQAQQGQATQAPQWGQAASQPPAPTALPDAATPDKATQTFDSSSAPTQQATAAPTDARPLKSQLAVPHELSPWSMFLSADILVKIVMCGLAFASLVTWTILIGKTFELSVIQRKLKGALKSIGNARSLAEAQFALGESRGVLSSLLDAAMHEARLSAGISGERNVPLRALQKSRARRGVASGSAWACWRRSARPRRSSVCSARSKAS